MLDNLDVWKIAVLLLLGIFLFGPERIPKIVNDAVRTIRTLRRLAQDAAANLSHEAGVDIPLQDLHPKTLIRKHLMGEDEQAQLLAPLRDVLRQAHEVAADAKDAADSALSPVTGPPAGAATPVDSDAT